MDQRRSDMRKLFEHTQEGGNLHEIGPCPDDQGKIHRFPIWRLADLAVSHVQRSRDHCTTRSSSEAQEQSAVSLATGGAPLQMIGAIAPNKGRPAAFVEADLRRLDELIPT